jgi:hypothetical protein
MTTGKKLSTLIVLCLILCLLAGVAAATSLSTAGSYFSTGTSVSVQGTVNQTVSIHRSTITSGITEKEEWISSYFARNPVGMSWTSQGSMGSTDGNLWWKYQRTGLPVSWTRLLGI